jgi:hypothetical protein
MGLASHTSLEAGSTFHRWALLDDTGVATG